MIACFLKLNLVSKNLFENKSVKIQPFLLVNSTQGEPPHFKCRKWSIPDVSPWANFNCGLRDFFFQFIFYWGNIGW